MSERPNMPAAADEAMIRWASQQLDRLGYVCAVSWRSAKKQYDMILVRPKSENQK